MSAQFRESGSHVRISRTCSSRIQDVLMRFGMYRRSACNCKGDWRKTWNGNKHVPFIFIAWPTQRCIYCCTPS